MKGIFKKLSTIIVVLIMLSCSMLFASCGKKENNNTVEEPANTENTKPEPVTIQVSSYYELKSAVKGTADIIKLVNDIDIKTESMNPKDFFLFERKLTLDLNGKKIYCTKNIYDESSGNKAMLEISEGADVTITGDGQVIAKENDAYAIQVTNGGKVTIENGEFIGNRNCISVYNGKLDIKGGRFSIQQKEPFQVHDPETNLLGYGYVIDCHDINIAYCSVVVKGGEFVNFNPKKNISNGVNTNYLVTGYKSILLPESTDSTKIYKVTVNN